MPLLRQRVAWVHGIDLSAPMIEQLLAKPGADQIGTTIGDCATTGVDGTFDVVYIVRNSITNRTTQDEQVECFCNAAAHLKRRRVPRRRRHSAAAPTAPAR